MTTKSQTATLIVLTASVFAGRCQTSNGLSMASAPSSPAPSALEQTILDIKHPVPWLSWGTDFRVRYEYFDNILTLNPNANLHEQSYMRFRARLWASVTPVEDFSFNVRLSDEVREWFKPAGYTTFKGNTGLDWRDGIFDTLNVQWRNILGQPLAATVGRQDIFLGDGWLMGDGTPFDGSWTYFLDSARLTYEFKEQHTTVEAIGIIQDAHDNGWMPTINQDQFLPETEQNEKGAVLWVANRSLPAANLTGYFFYKQDERSSGPNLPQSVHPDNANIYTPGGRVTGLVAQHWKYAVEGAYQFGQKQDPSITDQTAPLPTSPGRNDYRNINAFGVNTKLTYLLKDRLNDQFSFSYEFLSGDNPNTKDDEMFDNLWGCWPRWSEIGLYSFAAETRIGNEANMHRLGPSWAFNPTPAAELSLGYFALFAQQGVATRGPITLFAGNAGLPDHGLFRGHFLQAILKYQFSKHFSAHLWSEFEFPGNYYVHRAAWDFARAEVFFAF